MIHLYVLSVALFYVVFFMAVNRFHGGHLLDSKQIFHAI